MKFLALDLETKSYIPEHPEYALQPWRAKKREAGITSIMIGNNQKVDYTNPINISEITDYIWLWNGIFDIAWLEVYYDMPPTIKWLDAMSAAKWVMRSQHTDHPTGKRTSWSLAAIAKQCLKDWEYYEEYISLKDNVEDSEAYWQHRNVLDVKATYLLGRGFWEAMTDKQRRGFLIEQEALYPAAQAWVNGYLYDFKAAEALSEKIEERKEEICQRLGVRAVVLDSPKQLAELLYDQWDVTYDPTVNSKNKTEHRSVSGPVLTLIMESDKDPRLQLIKEYRDLKSRFDKFIKGPRETRKYLGSDRLHHQLRLNSTYTGRCTVSSKN